MRGWRRALAALVWFHRWLGVVTCLIFVVWFASGTIMLFQPYPSLSRSAQLVLEAPLDVTAIGVPPAAALAQVAAPATALRLVQRASRPAYLVEVAGGVRVVDARTAAVLPLLDRSTAIVEARRVFGRTARVAGPFAYDQWIVHNRFDAVRPFYRLDANDDAGTQLYWSARTGEVLQRTTRSERGWNWAGSVLHWVYFTPLRSSFTAWDRTVWWVSLICLLVAVAGTILGVVRMLVARRLQPPRFSFYRRRWMRWHHLLGLSTALFVLTWGLSDWLSMDHGRLFSRGTPTAAQATHFAGCPLKDVAAQVSVATIRAIPSPSELTFTTLACTLLVTRFAKNGEAARLDGKGLPLRDEVFQRLVREAFNAAWPEAGGLWIDAVDRTGTYALAEGWPAAALRIVSCHPSLPAVYVDGNNGRILTVMDRSRSAYVWIYYGLHTLNVPGLTSRPWLRRAVILIPLMAGMMFSLTAAVLGFRRIIT